MAGFAVLVEGRRSAARDLAGGMAGGLHRGPQQRGCHDGYSHALVLGAAGKCWLKGENVLLGFAVLVEGRRSAARDLAGGMAGDLRRGPQQRGVMTDILMPLS